MSSAEDLIREIAVRHGTALGRDDPILILHTLNERLMADNAKAQQAMLAAFQAELEAAAGRWDAASKARAERVLNAALGASQDAMKDHMAAGAREAAAAARREAERALGALEESLARTRQVALLNLAAAVLTLAAAGLAVWVAGHG